MTTLLLGRIRTCLFPRFSALYMDFRASPSTLTRTILVDLRAEQLIQACSYVERIDSESRQSSRAVAQGYYWLLLTGGVPHRSSHDWKVLDEVKI
jgi:hypothetical protein